jgi:hypothetical protein
MFTMAITKCIFQELGRKHVGALANQPMEVLVWLHLNHKEAKISIFQLQQ